jgi:hypothetical protein
MEIGDGRRGQSRGREMGGGRWKNGRKGEGGRREEANVEGRERRKQTQKSKGRIIREPEKWELQ